MGTCRAAGRSGSGAPSVSLMSMRILMWVAVLSRHAFLISLPFICLSSLSITMTGSGGVWNV